MQLSQNIDDQHSVMCVSCRNSEVRAHSSRTLIYGQAEILVPSCPTAEILTLLSSGNKPAFTRKISHSFHSHRCQDSTRGGTTKKCTR